MCLLHSILEENDAFIARLKCIKQRFSSPGTLLIYDWSAVTLGPLVAVKSGLLLPEVDQRRSTFSSQGWTRPTFGSKKWIPSPILTANEPYLGFRDFALHYKSLCLLTANEPSLGFRTLHYRSLCLLIVNESCLHKLCIAVQTSVPSF